MVNNKSCTALISRTTQHGITSQVERFDLASIPVSAYPTNANIVLAPKYSSVNYKDAMVLCNNQGNLVKQFPHVAGVDLAGDILESDDSELPIGMEVILTGFRYGEIYWGGYSTYAKACSQHVLPLPQGISLTQSMNIGTAGLTAMLAIQALERNGVSPKDNSPIVVTGATGGVGNWAVRLLAARKYHVIAITRRTEKYSDALHALGASEVINISDFIPAKKSFLDKASFQGAIDTLGGEIISVLASRMKYAGTVACTGLVQSAQSTISLYPLLLRGVRIIGIDSVMISKAERILAWHAIQEIRHDIQLSWSSIVSLDKVKTVCEDMLQGTTAGRTIVEIGSYGEG
ncbi:MAG: acryloyl-CoA reductase [Methylacidiphilales bacterium]|nr:acryloyl-CoA reductase [Candidatus Methylacidiphilales bacterium]